MSTRIILQLADEPEIFAWVKDSLEEGKRRCAFPSLRHDPSGGESCAVASVPGTTTAGFATFYAPYEGQRHTWLDLLWVEPAFRRQGIATQLIEAVVIECGPSPFHLALGTTIDNAAMHALASHCGFAPWGTTYALEVGK